jgi:hypothetical protein
MKWHEIDWSWYCPEDTVWRPTENAAFEHLGMLADLLRRTANRVEFTDSEWLVLLKDLELRRRNINATITAHDIAQALTGYDALTVEAIQRSISLIMTLREQFGLPALPVMPIQFKRMAKRLEKAA